jgi:iron-sulfur cluster assembly protein
MWYIAFMITVSESAAKKIASLKSEENRPTDAFLRVSVKRGGCSGFSYKMDFDHALQTSDKVFESNGQKVVVDGKSLLYLIGMQLDFEGGLNGKGFTFSNPNATKTCGCGSSFGV